MSETDPEALLVIKKVHKANSKDIETLINTFGVDNERLSDYGYYASGKSNYTEYESDSDLRDGEKFYSECYY